jgi:hypothetical protein
MAFIHEERVGELWEVGNGKAKPGHRRRLEDGVFYVGHGRRQRRVGSPGCPVAALQRFVR